MYCSKIILVTKKVYFLFIYLLKFTYKTGVGGVVLFAFTWKKKRETELKKGTPLHEKMAKAKVKHQSLVLSCCHC